MHITQGIKRKKGCCRVEKLIRENLLFLTLLKGLNRNTLEFSKNDKIDKIFEMKNNF